MLGDVEGDYEPPESDMICGPLTNPTLHQALHSMRRLSTVVVRPKQDHVFGHGLAWDTLCNLLSLPHLSRLVLYHVNICPIPLTAPPLQPPPIPLVCLRYILPNIREPYSEPSETEALNCVLRSVHLSLETLWLPAEPVRMDTFSLLEWPRLTELKLQGLRWTYPNLPAVVLFARMPNLRVLIFELMESDNASVAALWPRGLLTSYPWPYLENLSVSCPDLEDEIYAHLPPSMHTLKLHSWPHQCI